MKARSIFTVLSFACTIAFSWEASSQEVSASSAGQEADAPTSENTVADEPASSEATNESTARVSENANALTDTKIEALASELNSLKEQLVIPETEEKKSQYGFGPAASKVYAKTSGLSLGGYSEFYLNVPLAEEAVSTGDAYRFITYIGYKFSDNVVMNSEIEFEHGTTGSNVNGKAGSVSVEFVYLDFLGPQWLNFRTGLLLVPLGIINEIHEPVTYLTNMRPQTERTLMPSTWRNLGAGLHGALGGGFTYKLYGLNGMAGSAFDSSGIRSGRQKGNRVLAEDMAVAARLDWQQGGAFSFGTSAYYGGADHDPTQTAELTHGVAEAHGQIKTAGVLLRALYARSWINGAEASVPTEQEGYYIDAAYDLMPFVSFLPGTNLSPYLRYEQLDLNKSMRTGVEADLSLNKRTVTAGLQYQPHTDVVLKLDFINNSHAATNNELEQSVMFGAGFIF